MIQAVLDRSARRRRRHVHEPVADVDAPVPRAGRVASTVEHEPAQFVAEPLVVEHELSDLAGESGTLPPALRTAGLHAIVVRRCRPRRPDRVGCGAEFVGGHVTHRRGLAGSVRGMACGPAQVSGRRVGMAGGRASLCPRDPTPCPGTPKVDRPTGTVVSRPCLLEMRQHVLGAVGRPQRETAMIIVLEGPAAAHGDEPWIADLGEDQPSPRPAWRFATVRRGGSVIGGSNRGGRA